MYHTLEYCTTCAPVVENGRIVCCAVNCNVLWWEGAVIGLSGNGSKPFLMPRVLVQVIPVLEWSIEIISNRSVMNLFSHVWR